MCRWSTSASTGIPTAGSSSTSNGSTRRTVRRSSSTRQRASSVAAPTCSGSGARCISDKRGGTRLVPPFGARSQLTGRLSGRSSYVPVSALRGEDHRGEEQGERRTLAEGGTDRQPDQQG